MKGQGALFGRGVIMVCGHLDMGPGSRPYQCICQWNTRGGERHTNPPTRAPSTQTASTSTGGAR